MSKLAGGCGDVKIVHWPILCVSESLSIMGTFSLMRPMKVQYFKCNPLAEIALARSFVPANITFIMFQNTCVKHCLEGNFHAACFVFVFPFLFLYFT